MRYLGVMRDMLAFFWTGAGGMSVVEEYTHCLLLAGLVLLSSLSILFWPVPLYRLVMSNGWSCLCWLWIHCELDMLLMEFNDTFHYF